MTHSCKIRTDRLTGTFVKKIGVGQRHVLSLLIFNVYIDRRIKEALLENENIICKDQDNVEQLNNSPTEKFFGDD